MSRRGILYTEGFSPFPIPTAETWDGTTIFNAGDSGTNGWDIGFASASSEKFQLVCGPGTIYPMGFTLEQAVMLYWRIRHFKTKLASGEISLTSAVLDDTVTATGDGDDVTCNQFTDSTEQPETSLILGQDSYAYRGNDYHRIDDNENSGSASAELFIELFAPFMFGEPERLPKKPRMVKKDGLYYPVFSPSLDFFAERNTVDGDGFLRTEQTSYGNYPEYALGTDDNPHTIVFPDIQLFDVTFFKDEPEEFSGTIGLSKFISTLDGLPLVSPVGIEIGALKYFTYGGIYDEDTGERV